MWTYFQRSGDLFRDGTHFATGYSGHDAGKNNPDMQSVHDLGPLPVGIYRIGDSYDHPALGPLTMNLTPDPSNEMFGRSEFRIHGDSIKDPGTASHGCIVLPHEVRAYIAGHLDGDERLLEVKSDQEV
jgi:Protein of unknown function (DUF2778)